MITSQKKAEAQKALGAKLAARRKAVGLTQKELAPQVFMTRSSVANIECGRQLGTVAFWKRCDAVLAAHGDLIGAYDDFRRLEDAYRRQSAATGGGEAAAQLHNALSVGGAPTDLADVLAALVNRLVTEEDATNRRTAATLIATLLAGAGQSTTALAGWLNSTRTPRPTRGQLAAHVEMGELLAGMYRSTSPQAALPLIAAYADDLLGTYGNADSAEVANLIVSMHAQVGLWACHADQPALAYRYLATACEIASTQDRLLHARALGALSYLYSSAPRGGLGGNPRRALRLLDEALDISTRADPFTRGWLATWRADQHATLGNRDAAQADIDFATTALDARDDGQTSGFFSLHTYGYGMQGHLDSVRALTQGITGQTDEADRAFAVVQVHAANGRRRAASYAHQALAHVKTETPDPDAACAALLQSINLAAAEHYGMGITRAHGVRDGFPRTWANLACVQAFDERLRQLSVAG